MSRDDNTMWIDGTYKKIKEVNIPFLTHALHYGSAVFEGIRAYNGRAFKAKEHYERFHESAKSLLFEIPYSVDELCEVTEEILKINNLDYCYIRPLAWRGGDGLAISPENTQIYTAIAAWSGVNFFDAEYQISGIRVCIANYHRPPKSSVPFQAKASGLYVICSIEKKIALDNGFDDALLLDHSGHIAELTCANIFFIKDDEIYTPKPDCFLNGITRLTVIDIARKNGYKVNETKIKVEDLQGFDDCFITGTAAEILRVNTIQIDSENTVHYQEVSDMTIEIITKYKEEVES